MTDIQSNRLWLIPDLLDWYQCGRSALHDMRQRPDFPKPVYLPGSRKPRWHPEQFEPKPAKK